MTTKTVGRRNGVPHAQDVKVLRVLARGAVLKAQYNPQSGLFDDYMLEDQPLRLAVVNALLFHFWVREVRTHQFKLTSVGRNALQRRERITEQPAIATRRSTGDSQ